MTALTSTLPSLRWDAPALGHASERLERAGDHLWRVLDVHGAIRGHLRIVADPLGIRFRAERLHRASGRFQLVGEFWSAEDAVASLRH